MLTTEPVKQNGKPTEWHKPEQPIPQPKKTLRQRLSEWLTQRQKRIENSEPDNNETEEKSVYSEEEDSETEIEEDGIIGEELFGEDW